MTDPLTKQALSSKDFFRLIFVIFSLYLLGDAFSRWDGFSYYAPFSEFLPSVALAYVLWSIVSVVAASFLWSLFKLLEWLLNKLELRINIAHLLLSACVFLILGGLVWKGKKLFWPNAQTALLVKTAVFLSVVFLSVCLTWLFRNKAGQWFAVAYERITPLVWLFMACLIFSISVVAYHTWSDGNEPKRTGVAMQKERPNIILVTFDALAAGNMSLYGYEKETTPFVSEWAKNATVFTMTEASSNFTTPSAASLMTGKRVWTHQTYHIAGSKPVNSDVESLPALLKDNGYFNMAFVVNHFASVGVLGMSGSFDIMPLSSEFGSSDSLFGWKFGIIDRVLYRAFGDKIRMYDWILNNEFILSKVLNLISRNVTQTPVPPEKAFNMFLENIDADRPKPFFAWIHVFPPHDPYLPPEHFIEEGSNPALRTYKRQEKLIDESYIYLFQYKGVPEEMQPSIKLMRNYYDEFIRYCDKQFEEFIGKLNKKAGGNTLIILSADHGESFEHGYFTHGGPFLYEQVTHVPLIIKEPGQLKGQVIGHLVEQIDIPATILDFINVPVPEWMDGRSLVPLLRGKELLPRPAFSMNFEENRSRGHKITSGSVAVWEGDYKLIHYLGRAESLLFNLKRDPAELDNLIDKEPGVAQYLLGIIRSNLNRANERIRSKQ